MFFLLQLVVETLNEYLPTKRMELNSGKLNSKN